MSWAQYPGLRKLRTLPQGMETSLVHLGLSDKNNLHDTKMIDTCHHKFSKIYRLYNTKSKS
jgi:hypothetical protein